MSKGIPKNGINKSWFKKGTPSPYKKNYPDGFGINSRLYRCWAGMKSRCSNKKSYCYFNYGGRGISVCNEWVSFDSFRLWALANGYKDNLTLDRVDNDNGYSPENCRWIPKGEQSRNRRNVKFYTFNGVTETLGGFSRVLGVKRSTLEMRIFSYGWSPTKALSTPIKN